MPYEFGGFAPPCRERIFFRDGDGRLWEYGQLLPREQQDEDIRRRMEADPAFAHPARPSGPRARPR